MRVAIFNKHIQLKSMSCAHGHCQPQPIPKAVNLFVRVTDYCNARCPFCSNGGSHKNAVEFNHVKLWKVIDEIRREGITINRINITGGEPSVSIGTVNKILKTAISEQYHNIHLHLNTNGLLPASQEMMRHPRWNSISMSLHHYDQDKLSEIYGVPRLGFVVLMKVNDYCREHYIDFDEIIFNTIPHLYFTESRNRGGDCKCSNYLYNHNGRILEVYMRNYANPNYCESSLMFDGQYLRQGFHDDNIIY